jgi:magnesium chelatase family protein
MVAHISTFAFEGIKVTKVDVQVHLAEGIPAFSIVGLPDKAIGESKERVRAALHSLGLSVPAKRITVNLAPASITKEGSHYDLPIALGILVAAEIIPADALYDYMALGELSLDGSILSVPGILPAAIGAMGMEKGIICPKTCGAEAAWATDIKIIAPDNLLQLIHHFTGEQILAQPKGTDAFVDEIPLYNDLRNVVGQESAKRALEIAAAGGHNMLMKGSPGAGKSMLASCLPGILPRLTAEEMLEINMIHSVAGKLRDGHIEKLRPYREPHHSATTAAMVGGGRKALPGEISLAHNGVLFLDELPEFPRAVLESLRQPLETGNVSVARANFHVTYPAKFQLIAAMNPCRCGYLDDPAQACSKAPKCAEDYQNKLSGPLLDRIDLHIDVPTINVSEIINERQGEPSAEVAKRVEATRDIQRQRFAKSGKNILNNAHMDSETIKEFAYPDDEGMRLLTGSMEKMNISMRGFSRTLKLARTIADMENSAKVTTRHIAEALSYRPVNWNNYGN